MHGQRIGYVRVSSFDQNPERQLEQIQVDKVFTDKASGKDTRTSRSPNCCWRWTNGRASLGISRI